MIYRINFDTSKYPEGQLWFARQIEGQFSNLEREPLPAELRKLVMRLNDDVLGHPSS